MSRTNYIRILGSVSNHDDATSRLRQAGDVVQIIRGVPRSIIMRCPCGCGDNLVINLDSRTGLAWRHYLRNDKVTLYPSYWRGTHCRSHFILWNNKIMWCDWDNFEYWNNDSKLEPKVYEALSHKYINYVVLADQLDELPWDVLKACYSLTRKGKLEQHSNRRLGEFRLTK